MNEKVVNFRPSVQLYTVAVFVFLHTKPSSSPPVNASKLQWNVTQPFAFNYGKANISFRDGVHMKAPSFSWAFFVLPKGQMKVEMQWKRERERERERERGRERVYVKIQIKLRKRERRKLCKVVDGARVRPAATNEPLSRE